MGAVMNFRVWLPRHRVSFFLNALGAGGQGSVRELGQHGQRLGGHDQLHVRVLIGNRLDAAAVVGLQMLHHQVIRGLAVQHRFHVRQPFRGFPAVHGIHHGGFVVQDHIRVIGYAHGHSVLALKQIQVFVESAHVYNGIRNAHDLFSPFLVGLAAKHRKVYHTSPGK